MSKFGISQPVRRVEDQRFLTGQGRYVDDINVQGQAHTYVVRSTVAHGRILAVDTESTKRLPGVKAGLPGRKKLKRSIAAAQSLRA